MKDKPVPAKIYLTLSNKKAKGEEFITLSGMLYAQNLIFPEPRELRRKKNILELTVIFRDRKSFKNWEKNEMIQTYWQDKFERLLKGKLKTVQEKDVILEVDNVCNCTCKQSDFYIIQGRTLLFMDELTCNRCFKQVSYAKIPLEIKIEEWQNNHERVYGNWLDSGLFEAEALSELTAYKEGKLNVEGEKIRKQLSDFFKIPVYIYFFEDEPRKQTACIVCGKKGVDSGLKSPNKLCKKCCIAFNGEQKQEV